MNRFRQTTALLLILVYTSLVTTLDLHHNHSMHFAEVGQSAVAVPHGELHSGSSHPIPCPVLSFTLSHAPVATLSFTPTVEVEPFHTGIVLFHYLNGCPHISQRAPPLS